MKIMIHGGECCGIKHIHGLSYYPECMVAARRPIKRSSFRGYPYGAAQNDMLRHNKYRNYDFFNLAAPKETYEDRFKRLVSFIKEKRPHGIIEIVLNISMQKKWIPVAEGLGFKEVSKATNSNTSSVITVYHLTY